MSKAEVLDIIQSIRTDLDQGADTVLLAAEAALRGLPKIQSGDLEAIHDLEQALCAILEACAFHDIAGQRLTKLKALVERAPTAAVEPGRGGDPLLNGPALAGQGLDQTTADRLMANPPNLSQE